MRAKAELKAPQGEASATNLPATREAGLRLGSFFCSEFGTELVRHPFGSQLWRGFL
jgi:hypothetical protein